jgi:pimeloyl-ACP methyl ester carboxylesterase
MNAKAPSRHPLLNEERWVRANGLEFCFEERGPAEGEPLVLVMGLAAQMTLWPEALLDQYVKAGFRVIRFDNRDIGRSSEIDAPIAGGPLGAMLRFRTGRKVPAPYTLHDMAKDTAEFIDALGLESAHVVGASMGGMIAQLVAADYPEKVKTLTLIMTSPNTPNLPIPDWRVIWCLNGANVKGNHEAAAVARSMKMWGAIQSPTYPLETEELMARIRADFHRSYRPMGILRQMRAILATGDLAPVVTRIKAPTRIIHGADDRLIKPKAARCLARLIADSQLSILPGMAHDLPLPLIPEIAALTAEMAHGIERS